MRKLRRRTRRALAYLGAGILVAAAAIALALVVTPMQDVTVAGEEIGVGAAAPSLSFSGPGEVNLFGQRLPTILQFAGPVRPSLTLTHITLDEQLASMFRPGQQGLVPGRAAIGHALASAWTTYFEWEIGITGAVALLLTGALCGWAGPWPRWWRRWPWPRRPTPAASWSPRTLPRRGWPRSTR